MQLRGKLLAALGAGLLAVSLMAACSSGGGSPSGDAASFNPNGPHLTPGPGTDPKVDAAVVAIADQIEQRFGVKAGTGVQSWPDSIIGNTHHMAAYGGPIEGHRDTAYMKVIIAYDLPTGYWQTLQGTLVPNAGGQQGVEGLMVDPEDCSSCVMAQRRVGDRVYVFSFSAFGVSAMETPEALNEILIMGAGQLAKL